MRTLACDIASASTSSGGQREPWEVDQLTRKVYVRSLTDVLDPAEATLLRDACAERDGTVDSDTLSENGRAVYPLLTSLDVSTAERAIERLPEAMRERLDAMSPIRHVEDIHAPLVMLAHDCDDQVIPIGESRRLFAAFGDRAALRYTEFTMFKHLDPSQVELSRLALARELFRFFRSVYPVFRQAAGRPANRVVFGPPSRSHQSTSTSTG